MRFDRALVVGCLWLGSVLPASAQSVPLFTHGVACGEPSTSEVVLWTRTAVPSTIVPELLDNGGGVQRDLPAVKTTADADNTVKTVAGDLRAGETVHYRFRGPNGELSPTGACKTAPPPDSTAAFSFAFSGDTDWKWRPYPVMNALNREPIDFFIFLGDTIYETTNFEGTTVAENLAEYRAKYRENRELPSGLPADGPVPMREMYASFGIFSVPDNHELGTSVVDPNAPRYTEGGAPAAPGSSQLVNQTPGFDARMRAYEEYQPLHERPGGPNETRQQYFSQPWGETARLIVVDDRSYRDVRLQNSDDARADDPNRTMLGATQFQWLENELLSAQADGTTWKFLVVSSPIQHIGRESEIGFDLDGSKSWAGGYRVERDRLLKFIDDQAIDNVVFLTTDNHNTMINNLRYRQVPENPSSPMVPARNAFEILTGPLGAGFGYPVRADLLGLTGRDAERAVAGLLAGLQTRGGVDPIGLEARTVDVVPSSVQAEGGAPGVVEPAAFNSFDTFTYAVLTVDGSTLTVRVTGHPGVDPATLTDPGLLARYAATQSHTILSFQVTAR
jgi:alkaline phosphatase D